VHFKAHREQPASFDFHGGAAAVVVAAAAAAAVACCIVIVAVAVTPAVALGHQQKPAGSQTAPHFGKPQPSRLRPAAAPLVRF
jgi:hypothetical protein